MRRCFPRLYHTAIVVLSVYLLCACLPVPAAPASVPAVTRTPTPEGTWRTTIQGTVYAGVDAPSTAIAGATVRYDVLHSHFAGLQESLPHATTTGEDGSFSLAVLVHDTDSARIVVEATGYISYEERLGGVDLLAGRNLDVGLSPSATATVSP